MSFEESGITHKRLDDMLIASLRFQMREREELPSKFEKLRKQCEEYISGPAFAVYYWDTGLEGFDTEACFPVTHSVETGEIKSRMLEGGEVFTMLHHGSHENLTESYREMGGRLVEHGLNAENTSREIYLEFHPDSPEENVTEIQVFFVNWEERLAENLKRVLGADAEKEVARGAGKVTLESSGDERVDWVKGAMRRLDELAGEEQRFDILSRCAHIFSQKRIERLKAVYERNGDIDEVLEAMHEDPDWYEGPVREGAIIYVTKVPRNPEGYEAATNEAEKRMHYCHCAIARRSPDEVPPTFCYCGAGWYRQIWEGILGEPVRVEILKSLTGGDDTCEFAIHLPS
ncbi:MAG: GyrI-like domain-containing protein [Anaerolineae bacterium]